VKNGFGREDIVSRLNIHKYIWIAAFLALSCFKENKSPVAPQSADHPAPAPLLSMAAENLWLYQDALANPWLNASWSATVTFNSTERVQSGIYAIKVALTSAWGALSLHYGTWFSNPGINPAEYQSFDLAVYAPAAGTRLAIFAENDQGQSFPKFEYGTVAQNQWVSISVPMSQLSPNGQMIHRIAIQDLSGAAVTFYVDNIRFAGISAGSPPATPTLVSPPDGASQVATNPTYSWNPSSGAASYRIQVSTESSFTSTVADQAGITGTSHTMNGLTNSTMYYWRVNAANSAGTSNWSAAAAFTTRAAATAAPDLTIDAERLRSSYRISWKSFSSSSCAVVEECASPGSRKLLRFDVVVPNFGTADLVMGDPSEPANSDDFIFSPCHGHYHYEGFAEYRLLNQNQVLVRGHKQAFCLMDSQRYWSGSPSRGFDCHNQGISVGWADVYDRTIDCQWIDITGVSPGNYFLEVEVNVNGKINEGENEWPNVARVAVTIR
jgi:hypothetical protein